MIAIDTNVVVRLLTGDDQAQYEKVLALFNSHDVFIPISVILECEWVLRYAYSFDAKEPLNRSVLLGRSRSGAILRRRKDSFGVSALR